MNKIIILALCISASSIATLLAVDYPTSNRAQFFQGRPPATDADGATQIDIHYGQGSSIKGYADRGTPTALLATHGGFNLSQDYVSQVKVGGVDPSLTTFLAKSGDKKSSIEFGGKFNIQQLNIDVRQNICWGLFVGAHLPVSWLKITDIKAVGANAATFDDTFRTNLDALNATFGLQPITTEFKKAGAGDLGLYVGWHGEESIPSTIVSNFKGIIQAGVVCPVGAKSDLTRVFSLPLGYEGFWGVDARARIEISMLQYLGVGFTAGCIVFFPHHDTYRVKTARAQNSWAPLTQAYVRKDQGSSWNVGTHLRAGYEPYGINAYVGIAYSTQEPSLYKMRPKDQLETIPTLDENIMNSDNRLDRWYHASFNFMLEVDSSKIISFAAAPHVAFTYDMPHWGRYAFKTAMMGGALGLNCVWNF